MKLKMPINKALNQISSEPEVALAKVPSSSHFLFPFPFCVVACSFVFRFVLLRFLFQFPGILSPSSKPNASSPASTTSSDDGMSLPVNFHHLGTTKHPSSPPPRLPPSPSQARTHTYLGPFRTRPSIALTDSSPSQRQ
jgi:hypothetical protein